MEPDVTEFCCRVHPELVRVLTVHCGDRAVAEDLSQEALVRTVANWSRVRIMERPTGWVFRVAFNLAASRWRRLGAERRALHKAGTRPLTVGDSSEESAARLTVRAALMSLPQRQRAAITLRFLADLSVADTAVALSCREGTVKSLTSQALTSLRGSLDGLVDVPVLEDELRD